MQEKISKNRELGAGVRIFGNDSDYTGVSKTKPGERCGENVENSETLHSEIRGPKKIFL